MRRETCSVHRRTLPFSRFRARKRTAATVDSYYRAERITDRTDLFLFDTAHPFCSRGKYRFRRLLLYARTRSTDYNNVAYRLIYDVHGSKTSARRDARA